MPADYSLNDINLKYYDTHAASFIQDTCLADISECRDLFVSKLNPNDEILDFGCGSGRDTKAFLQQGFRVDAIDGSEEMCRFASEYTGIKVRNMLFRELDERDRYNGIWACASILHVPGTDLPDILKRMKKALKKDGVIYISFKYGTFEGERNGRYFTDQTETSFAALLEVVGGLRIEEEWISADARPDRKEQKWLNVILRKNEMEQML